MGVKGEVSFCDEFERTVAVRQDQSELGHGTVWSNKEKGRDRWEEE